MAKNQGMPLAGCDAIADICPHAPPHLTKVLRSRLRVIDEGNNRIHINRLDEIKHIGGVKCAVRIGVSAYLYNVRIGISIQDLVGF